MLKNFLLSRSFRAPQLLTLMSTTVLVATLSACPDRPDPVEPDPTPESDGGDPGPAVEPEFPPTGCALEDIDVIPPRAPPSVVGGQIDFSCLGNPEVFAASTNVTAQGCVDIFGLGGSARAGLKIAIFANDQDPSTDAPAYGETEIAVASQAGPLQALAAACPKSGYYRLPNVPTHVPLVIKVFETESGPQQIAIPSYTYGIVLYDRDAVDGAVDYEASLIYKSTYDSIPTLGGQRIDGQQIIYDGIGRGVIAGEARDCSGATLRNATVTSDQFDNTTKAIYFNGDTEDPSPDLAQSATNDDGLFALLNVATEAGSNVQQIVATVVDSPCSGDDCQCRFLGNKTVRTFPDSVTLVSFEKPYPIIDPNVDVDAGPVDVDAGDEDAGVVDAGETDAGDIDSGVVDAGDVDSGIVDAGDVDAGATDAGATDAGATDAGATDAG